MDWVGHHVDIAHWGLGFDRTGPLEVEGWGEFPATGLWDSATRYKVELKYAGGLAMTIADGSVYPGGTKWIGDKGWVHVNRRGMTTEPAGLKNVKLGAGEVHLYKSPGHHQDFLDCVRSRRETITSCETAHRSATPGHLGQISMLLGRKIRFDPETEEIIGDAEASKMLGNVLRSPWKI